MSLTARVVIPTSELNPTSPKLKTYLNETSEGLCRLCVSQLSAKGPEYPLEDFFFERILGDEGIPYTPLVSELYKEYTEYLVALEDALIKYLGINYQYARITLVNYTDTVFVLECKHDPIDSPERPDGHL